MSSRKEKIRLFHRKVRFDHLFECLLRKKTQTVEPTVIVPSFMLRFNRIRLLLPSESFRRFVELGTLRDDPRQQDALVHIDRVHRELEAYSRNPTARDMSPPAPIRKGSQSITYVRAEAAKKFLREHGVIEKVHPLSKIRGVYLCGGVGCGKTHLMDIFFNEAPVARKQRVHFHQFMLDVHKMQHQIRTKHGAGQTDSNDIMKEVAIRICHNAELLCFDELVVADVADAMILKRLFHAMYSVGICCVFTSNRLPNDLYKSGLNRETFLPFVRMLEEKCHVHEMQSDTDYRLTGRRANVFFSPLTDGNVANFNKLFLDITHQRIPGEKVLRVFGRDVVAPKVVGAVAYFTYQELCVEDKSAADYGVLAKVFHTIFIEGVPRFGPHDSDGRRRFITLIDELYQAKVKVIVLAESPLELMSASDEEVQRLEAAQEGKSTALLNSGGQDDDDDALSQVRLDEIARSKEESFFAGKLINSGEGDFQMKRCISRLQEMRTQEYLESKHTGPGEVSLLDGA